MNFSTKFKEHFKTKASKAIVIVLTTLFIASSFMFVRESQRNILNEFKAQYPYLDFARNFVDQKHFIINIEPLRNDLRRIASNTDDANISIYFEVLNTGANISINQDLRFVPGSLIKLPTSMAVLKKIEAGEWSLEDEFILYEEDKNNKFGDMHKYPEGSKFKISELLDKLLIDSDDTAHKILYRNVKEQQFNSVLSSLGLEELFDENYYITAKEYSRIFRSLYTSSYLTRKYSQYLLELLTKSNFNNYLRKGLPDIVTFSHKTGIHVPRNTYLDSGIVYIPNRPYILTVIVNANPGKDQKTAEKIMEEISSRVYEYIQGYDNTNL